MKLLLSLLIAAIVLVADQWLKLWVVDNMVRGQDIHLFGDWFILHYTQNYGIAFGLEFFGRSGKVFLSLFRMVAVVFIGFFLVQNARQKTTPTGFVIAIALIFSGAIGNIIDSVFYGVWFDYDTWLHGRVVDMFYLPIINTQLPGWLPIWGGERFVFFRPVFNIADAAISTGVLMVLLFYRDQFNHFGKASTKEDKQAPSPPPGRSSSASFSPPS